MADPTYVPGANAERVNRLRAAATEILRVMAAFHAVALEIQGQDTVAALVEGDLLNSNQDLMQVVAGDPPALTLRLALAQARIGAGVLVGEGMYQAMHQARTVDGQPGSPAAPSYFDVIAALSR